MPGTTPPTGYLCPQRQQSWDQARFKCINPDGTLVEPVVISGWGWSGPSPEVLQPTQPMSPSLEVLRPAQPTASRLAPGVVPVARPAIDANVMARLSAASSHPVTKLAGALGFAYGYSRHANERLTFGHFAVASLWAALGAALGTAAMYMYQASE